MKRCLITCDPIKADGDYSARGLKLLDRNLTSLAPLGYTAAEQRQEALERAGKMSIQGVQLKLSGVLIDAIADDVAILTWHKESFAYAFAYADDWDEAGHRYRGLRCGQQVSVAEDSTGVLVKPEPALRQYEAERTPTPGPTPGDGTPGGGATTTTTPGGTPTPSGAPSEPPKPKRFHGTVNLDAQRVGRDAGIIAQEVVSHLAGIIGADVKVTIEIDAFIQSGASEQVVRTVTENCRTLKFSTQGFEVD